MHKLYQLAGIIVCIHLLSLSAPAQQSLYRTDEGFIKFVSDAPLEFITAQSDNLRGVVDPDRRTFAFQLEVNTLKGFNSPLQQEHFYENYMETDEFPKASFSGKIIEIIDYESAGKQVIRAKGLLDIHGVKQERILKVNLMMKGDQMTVDSEFVVPLADHNISIPQLVHQKIAEEIRVTMSAVLKKISE